MYSSNKLMPPLWIWLLLGVTCATLMIMLVNMVHQKEEMEFRKRGEYLSQPLNPVQHPYILFVGSSLTQCGLDSTRILEEEFYSVAGKRPIVRKLWRRATSLDELFGVIQKAEGPVPDVMVVEANMIFYSAKDRSLSYKLSLALRELRRRRRDVTYNPEEKPPSSPFDAKAVDGFRGELVDTADLQAFCDIASQLTSRGTKVVLLNFPLEKTADSSKWESADTSVYKQNVNFIKQRLSTTEVFTDLRLDSTHYIDRGHMNLKGAKVFSKNLQKVLLNHLQVR